ncbi:hypothetical protein C0Z16_19885 [Paraburkholderia rhynchosiae]|uniref:Uncharacterized protein n=1 Tax=Paraburkholderia rhynchosiae TaxID=487049 RepID=A0ABX4V1L9_9BURK|nr:hypothetical protein C0Z16_19885 [Paraburkholderia rhynchosiae]
MPESENVAVTVTATPLVDPQTQIKQAMASPRFENREKHGSHVHRLADSGYRSAIFAFPFRCPTISTAIGSHDHRAAPAFISCFVASCVLLISSALRRRSSGKSAAQTSLVRSGHETNRRDRRWLCGVVERHRRGPQAR